MRDIELMVTTIWHSHSPYQNGITWGVSEDITFSAYPLPINTLIPSDVYMHFQPVDNLLINRLEVVGRKASTGWFFWSTCCQQVDNRLTTGWTKISQPVERDPQQVDHHFQPVGANFPTGWFLEFPTGWWESQLATFSHYSNLSNNMINWFIHMQVLTL